MTWPCKDFQAKSHIIEKWLLGKVMSQLKYSRKDDDPQIPLSTNQLEAL